jgi:hypothetical protein
MAFQDGFTEFCRTPRGGTRVFRASCGASAEPAGLRATALDFGPVSFLVGTDPLAQGKLNPL